MDRNKLIKNNFIFICIFLIVAILNFYKLKIGMLKADEAFYLTIPKRIIAGDILLVHEWHPSQLVGLILLPFVKLHSLIFSSNEGIALNFRYLYFVLNSLVTILMYIKLKKYSKLGASLGVISYYIFTPWSIMVLSYNTVGLMVFMLSGIFLLEKNRVSYILSGLFFALGVLCNPYMIITFFIFSSATFISLIFKNNIFSFEKYKYFIVGTVIPFVYFLIYSVINIRLGDFLKSLPHILHDPSHLPRGLKTICVDYLYIFKFLNSSFKYVYFLMILIIIINIFLKNKIVNFISALLFIIFYLYVFYSIWHSSLSIVNYIMFPLNFLGLLCFIVTPEKRYDIFIYLYSLGWLYSFFMNVSSNTGTYVISMALTISLVASFIFIVDYLKYINASSQKNEKILIVLGISLILIFQLLLQVKSKLNYVFEDMTLLKQTEKINYGVAKGLIVEKKEKEFYENYYEDIVEVKNNISKDDKIFYISKEPWFYLESNNSIGSFSAWLGGSVDAIGKRLDEFYNIYPDKMPDYIYVLDSWMVDDIMKIFPKEKYNYIKLKNGYLLKKK